jgi:cell wall-associated NlpC family hydrolase
VPAGAELARAEIVLDHLGERRARLVERRERLERRRKGLRERLRPEAFDGKRGPDTRRQEERRLRQVEARLEVTRAALADLRAARRVVVSGLSLRSRHLLAASDGETRGTEVTPFGDVPLLTLPESETSAASPLAALAASYALTQIGVSYRWAGRSPETGFDCSGLVYWSFQQVGISVPHQSAEVYALGRRIPLDQLQPGDVLSFRNRGHVGLYIGGGHYVHSTQSGDVIRVSPVSARGDVDGAVRIG